MPVRKRRIRWIGLEAISLMESAGLDDPLEAIRKKVDQLLQETEQRNVPIDLRIVTSFQGITKIRTESLSVAAMLLPTASGLQIIINKDDSIARQHFSIAHEICHTLFPSFNKQPVAKVDKWVGKFSIPQEEEYLCDFGASCLLLPQATVVERISSHRPCLDQVIQLAEDCRSSLEAAAIAWVYAFPSPCAILFLEEGLKPRQVKREDQLILPGMEEDFKLEPELRITLACTSTTFPWFVPKHKSVSRNGVIYAALTTQGRTQGADIIELQGEPREVKTESMYSPYRVKGSLKNRVVSYLSC